MLCCREDACFALDIVWWLTVGWIGDFDGENFWRLGLVGFVDCGKEACGVVRAVLVGSYCLAGLWGRLLGLKGLS